MPWFLLPMARLSPQAYEPGAPHSGGERSVRPASLSARTDVNCSVHLTMLSLFAAHTFSHCIDKRQGAGRRSYTDPSRMQGKTDS
jgi:hypothetical protein